MTALRFRGRVAAWSAAAAMALNTFWPLIASAKPAEAEVGGPICSAAGLGQRNAPADLPDRNPLSLHCALCVFHAALGVAVTGTTRAPSEPAAAGLESPAGIAAQRPEAAFDPAAPPRAPPSPLPV